VVFITLGTLTAVFYVCVNRYLLLFSVYFAQFQLFRLLFLHTVDLSSCDVHQNHFIEICTSLIWVIRYLHILSTFLAQFRSNSVYDFSIQCS
jgi:hypothetical protein